MNNAVSKLKSIFTNTEKLTGLNKKTLAAVLMLIAGVLLLLFCTGKSEKEKEPGLTQPEETVYAGDYETKLEERLISIISTMDGVGRVEVMVTLNCGSEDIYLRDSDSDESVDKDGKSSSQRKNEYVIIDDGDKEKGIVIRVAEPEIRGVAVVCDGGGNESVKQRITEAVTALLGVSSARVSVSPMK